MPNLMRLMALFVVLATPSTLAQCSDNDSPSPFTTSSCALSCLETFINNYYPTSTCPNNQDLNCLCTTSNASGLTLGEAAFQCVVSECSDVSSEQLAEIYGICSGIQGALPETHATITATIIETSSTAPGVFTATDASSTFTLPSSIPPPTNTTAPSSITIAPSSSTLESSETSAPTTLGTQSSSTLSPEQTPASQTSPDAATTPSASPFASPQASSGHLSSGTVAGIAVGGVAAAFAGFGLIFLCVWVRKRRRRKREEWESDSYDKARRSYRPPSFLRDWRPEPAVPVVNQPVGAYVPPAGQDNRRSFWRKSIKPEDIGVAVSPPMPQEESPAASMVSQGTTSALLPEKPLWPSPLRPTHPPKDNHDRDSNATVFDEDLGGLGLGAGLSRGMEDARKGLGPPLAVGAGAAAVVDNKGKGRQADPRELPLRSEFRPPPIHAPNENFRPQPPRLVVSGRTGNGLPTDPRARMYALERQQRMSSYRAQPRVPLTPKYDNGNFPTFQLPEPQPPQPVLPPGPMRDPRLRLVPGQQNLRTASSNYDSVSDLPPSEPRSQHNSNISTMAQVGLDSEPPPPRPVSRSGPPPPSGLNPVRSSVASSTTTFEDDPSDSEAEPSSQPSRPSHYTPSIRHVSSLRPTTLSPVIESPRRLPPAFPSSNEIPPVPRSPIANLQYPSVPRPKNTTRAAERLPMPRASKYVDTSGPAPPPLKRPTTAMSNSSMSVQPPASLAPSSSSIPTTTATAAAPASTNRATIESRYDGHGYGGTPPPQERSPSPTERSSALLAQRRGQRKQLQLSDESLRAKKKDAQGWRVMPDSYPQRGNDPRREREREMGEVPTQLKSPKWAPKLTPTRGRGGDLYIRVE
ncbi:MAG: hypothetical protein Q9227_006711 [Pyrenula ochraceoflavens]